MSDLVFGVKFTADGKQFVGEAKITRESLDGLTEATKRTKSEAERLRDEHQRGGAQMGQYSTAAQTLSAAVKTLAASYAVLKVVQYAKEAALLSARYETLGISMYQAGKNAGYMRSEMDAYQASLEKTGISMTESRNTLIQMSAANMDLANATKLARAAQDLAVVGNTNSSEAFNRLIYGIKSGQVEVLRTLGINVSFEESYKRLGAELHKNASALTENEKLQARTNATMEAAAKYQGVYEEAMGTAGKQLGSLARYQENYKVILGETFNEGLAFGVGAFTSALKDATSEAATLKEKGDLKEWGRATALTLATVADSGRMAGNTIMAMQLTLRQLMAAARSLTPGSSLSIADSNVLIDKLQAEKDEYIAGMADNLKVYNSVNEGFAKSDETRVNAAKKAAQELIEVPKAAVAAYLAYGNDLVNAQKAYIMVMEASTLEWKGRGKVEGSSTGADGANERAKHIEAEAKSYARLNKSATAHIAVLEAEANATAKLPKAYQDLIGYLATYEKGLTAQNEAAQQAYIASLAQAAGLELAAAATAEATKADEAATKAAEEMHKLYFDNLDALNKSTASIVDDTQKLRDQNIELTYGKDALERVKEARAQATLVTLQATLAGIDETNQTSAQAEAIRGKIAALEDYAAAQGANDFAKHVEEETKLRTDMWKKVDDVARDTFVNIWGHGKSTLDRLRDTLKNGLLAMLYEMGKKQFLISIGVIASGTTASGMAAASSMAGGSGGAGAGSWLSGASSIYSAVNAGITTSISQGVAQVGATFWNAGAEQIGNAIMTNIAPMTAAISYLGAGMAGITIGTMIAGDKEVMGMSGQTTSTAGAIIGAIVGGPIGAAIGGTIGGLINAAFGMGPVQSGTTTLAGQFGAEGFAGQYQTPWHQEGGWFRSDRSGVNSTALAQEQVDAFAAVTEGTASVFTNLIAASGDATRSLDGWNFAINRQVATQEQQQMLVIDMAESMGNYLIPSLNSFKAEGENLADTAVRMRDEFVLTSSVAALLGQDINAAFGEIGLASMAARDNLVQLMGGIQGMNATVQSYYQNFFSDTERHALELTALSGKFAQLGQTIPETRDSYRDLIEAQDMSTEAGRQMFAALMSLNGEFAALVPAIEDVTAATQTAEAALQYQTTMLDLQGQISELNGNELMVTAVLIEQRRIAIAELNASDPTGYLAALTNQLWGLQDAAAAAAEAQAIAQESLSTAKSDLLDAYNRESSAAQQLAERMTGFADGFNRLRTSLALGALSTLSPEAKYLEAKRQFEDVSRRSQLGDVAALGELENVSQSFLQTSRDYNASSAAYAADFQRVSYALQSSGDVATRQADIATSQVTLLQGQLSALGLINTSVLSVVDAMAAFAVASAAVAGPPPASVSVSSSLGSSGSPENNSAYNHPSGVAANDADTALLTAAKLVYQSATGGVSTAQFNAAAAAVGGDIYAATGWNGDPESFRQIHGFATGGDHAGGLRIVGERGWEMEATGASRIFNHDQAKQILSGGDNSALIVELKALRAEVAKLREENATQADKVAGAVGDAADANTLDLRGLKQSLAHGIGRLAA